jgi:hypothetical protein
MTAYGFGPLLDLFSCLLPDDQPGHGLWLCDLWLQDFLPHQASLHDPGLLDPGLLDPWLLDLFHARHPVYSAQYISCNQYNFLTQITDFTTCLTVY